MALIVEDGTGVLNAESLASVAFADAYHAARGNDAWSSLTLATKEQLLRKATDYIVSTYWNAWAGSQILITQALPFPRWAGAVNVGVPLSVKEATVELALICKTTPLMPNVSRGKKRVKVGPIEVEYDGNSTTATRFVIVSSRLAPWLNGFATGVMAKLVRS